MRALLATAALVVVAGCSGGPGTTAASPTPVRADLIGACAAVSAAIPADTYDSAQMRAFLYRLAALNNAGDGAVRTALRPLAEPVAQLAGQITASAHIDFLDALSSVAADCRAAGSKALG